MVISPTKMVILWNFSNKMVEGLEYQQENSDSLEFQQEYCCFVNGICPAKKRGDWMNFWLNFSTTLYIYAHFHIYLFICIIYIHYTDMYCIQCISHSGSWVPHRPDNGRSTGASSRLTKKNDARCVDVTGLSLAEWVGWLGCVTWSVSSLCNGWLEGWMVGWSLCGCN